MKNFHSIRNKLLVVILLTSFCALFVAGSVILFYDIDSYRTTRINDMTTQIELLSFSSAPALQFADSSVAQENLELLELRPSVRAAAIYNARGNVFAGYVREDASYSFPGLPGDEGVTIDGSDLIIFKRIIENDEILGTAYIISDYMINERILNFVGIFALVALGAMFIAVLVSFWLQAIITKPILSVVDIARGLVDDDDYSRRATKISNDEVGILVDAFNEMLDEIASQTRALESANEKLETEVGERKRAREEILELNEELELKVHERTQQLQVTNQELESFCYSVSHDLRGPLRSINGFSQALIEELPPELPGDSKRYLDKITAAATRMGQLIEDLLNLSRVSRGDLVSEDVDLSGIANEVINDLQALEPDYKVDVSVWDGIVVSGDPKLLRIVFENLLGNAWKFTSKNEKPRVEVGSIIDSNRGVYYVRDNGAGFDMTYADKLFGAFQRLHSMDEYPGTGIGLATVQRIIHRHGGRIWFNSSPGNGAVFYFTLKPDPVKQDVSPDITETERRGDKKPRLRSV